MAIRLFAKNVVRRSGVPTRAIAPAGRQATSGLGAARPIADADRIPTLLLAAVSHDLRAPLAAAKAAVSGLRSRDIQLSPHDHYELLATAEESLDLLTALVASLLDVSRLRAGAVPVFPRPTLLRDVVARSLNSLADRAQTVKVNIPRDLPQVLVDPVLLERVVANVTANALRYSPSGSPPLLIASSRGDRVDLHVVDRGPGVPEADWNRMFEPFERLGDASGATGVGLGLMVSRGLAEAMRGTLEPERTPGGGLTLAISVPAVPGVAARWDVRSPRRNKHQGIGSAHCGASTATALDYCTGLE
jgi:two-component system sensor histidine kinase KdpD